MRTRPFTLILTIAMTTMLLGPGSLASAVPAAPTSFTASLSGSEEVPAVETRARGTAVLQLRSGGEALDYRLIVANIENVTMAHIHLAGAGSNGPVVAWLYPDSPPPVPLPGRTNGVLATGRITDVSLVGPLAGQPLSALVDHIRAGNAYVNVHTEQYPAGEVRGQL